MKWKIFVILSGLLLVVVLLFPGISVVSEEIPINQDSINLENTWTEKSAELPCTDIFGDPFGPQDIIVFWNYEKLEPKGTTYTPPLLGIQFEYDGTDSLYYPISPTEEFGEDAELEKFVKFDRQSESICVGDWIDNTDTRIRLYEDGMIFEDYPMEEWMNDISMDEGRPIETVSFGDNTYSRIKGTNLGTGLVDFYFIEHEGDYYYFSFAWTGSDEVFAADEWWTLSSLPEEYEKVLETVEFL